MASVGFGRFGKSAIRDPQSAMTMGLPVQLLWLIPALPLLAAGIGALTPRRGRTLASGTAIAAMIVAFLLSCGALITALQNPAAHLVHNFAWFELGNSPVRL